MRGIIGYIGRGHAIPTVTDGEYRGYGSAGIDFPGDDRISVGRYRGKMSALEAITATLTEQRCHRPHEIGHAWQTFRKKGGY